jgi:hypothetical protein
LWLEGASQEAGAFAGEGREALEVWLGVAVGAEVGGDPAGGGAAREREERGERGGFVVRPRGGQEGAEGGVAAGDGEGVGLEGLREGAVEGVEVGARQDLAAAVQEVAQALGAAVTGGRGAQEGVEQDDEAHGLKRWGVA